MYLKANGDIIQGEWLNGKAHGIATYTQKGRVEGKPGNEYTGQWIEGKKHGKGVETWPDGAKFEGYYKDDKKHG